MGCHTVAMTRSVQEAYEDLANAVVVTAANDYRTAIKLSLQGLENEMTEIERFLTSGYFNVFTQIDGDVIIKRIKQEFGLE